MQCYSEVELSHKLTREGIRLHYYRNISFSHCMLIFETAGMKLPSRPVKRNKDMRSSSSLQHPQT
jgi:hypothetical protein